MTKVYDTGHRLPRINVIWAAVSVDDGGEAICAALIDGAWVPLMASDEAQLPWVITGAKSIARNTGKRIKIIKLTARVEIADIPQFGSH